jgi:hypothetical protein
MKRPVKPIGPQSQHLDEPLGGVRRQGGASSLQLCNDDALDPRHRPILIPPAVVDPRLRVKGIQGPRVADASIMPAALDACTHVPTIMIGEKAATMIAEDV